MKIYDDLNMNNFEHGNKYYLCCNCGNLTTLDDSISSQGKHLICNRCAYKIAHILNTDFYHILEHIHKGLINDDGTPKTI